MRKIKLSVLLLVAAATGIQSAALVRAPRPGPTAAQTAPTVRIALPERFRVLTGQQFDLRIETAGLANANAAVKVAIDGADVTGSLPPAEVTNDNDADPAALDKAWTYRKISLAAEGVRTLQATVTDGSKTALATARIGVQDFKLKGGGKSIVLFIGDAMGTAYRDAARIVGRSTRNRFREGFFDELLEMDQMPVTGMVMTYAMDRVVPDSANTATAWSTGSKTIDGALGVFPDNDDFKFRSTQATKQFALNNPRIETLWEYLKRRFGYRTGIVTTADVTDATPAGEGAHTITRTLGNDIARQYVDGVFTSGPTFDVILGGGKERFDARTDANSGDTRDLAHELQAAGYAYVRTRSELNALGSGASAPDKLLGLFRTGNMNVAVDKLGLARPADEPAPSFEGFNDQPFLDEMTAKAIATLGKNGGPYILMVEGASIDKQSHPNHAAGQIWDTLEFDKAIGVVRKLINNDKSVKANTLVLVTADHDQSMSIIGVTDSTVAGSVQNVRSTMEYPSGAARGGNNAGVNPGEAGGFPDYADANNDGYPENNNRFRIVVGYRTGNHTGSSVPITAEGAGALLFVGYFDQTDVFFKMAKVLSTKTKLLDDALAEKQRSESINQNY